MPEQRAAGRGPSPPLDQLGELLRLSVTGACPMGRPYLSRQTSKSVDAAVSIAVLKCSANRSGLSKTEVDACVVIHCPMVWGRGTRQSKIALENAIFQLTSVLLCGIR